MQDAVPVFGNCHGRASFSIDPPMAGKLREPWAWLAKVSTAPVSPLSSAMPLMLVSAWDSVKTPSAKPPSRPAKDKAIMVLA